MDRQIVYSGQVPQTTDLLNTNRQTMIALAKLCADLFGTSTVVSGLGCVPTTPASMSVTINPGQIYQLANVDGTAYSALPADTAHSLLKQGILMDAQSFILSAPATAGYSQNYLIQAAYLENDINNVVLPYYNSANPSQAFNGPGGSGNAQPTTRAGQVSLQLVAGTAAATGTQTTPAVTAGYVGLAIITVANGQSTITAANIAPAANAPVLPTDLLHSIQQSAMTIGVDTGTANAYVIGLNPPIATLTDNMVLWFKAKNANTGASTINIQGLGAIPLIGGAHVALQGGEIIANGKCQIVYRADINSAVLVECTGGAVQVAPAQQASQAVPLSQVLSMRARFATNGSFTVPAGVTQIWLSGCAGGGGGGGAAGNNGVTNQAGGGGGGGGGQWMLRQPYAVTPGQVIPITVGGGGTAGIGGSAGVNSGGNGGNGGNTIIGTLATLTGGGGGGGGANPGGANIGSGAAGGVGYPSGSTGDDGAAGAAGGAGASSPFGCGAPRVRGAAGTPISAAPGSGFGAGGGGGGGVYANYVSPGGNGSAGMPGVAMIEW